MNSLCFLGTLLWINNIDFLYWWIGYRYWCVPTFWPRLPLRPSKDTLRQSVFLVGASLRILHSLMYSSLSLSLPGSGWGGSRTCWVMGTARSRHSHTPQSGYSPALMPLAGAASGSCSARTNSGRGHGKRRDGSTELCYHWHSDWRVCVCACKCVCLSLKRTDWLTVNPPAVCMICPILHPATLCKQQFSGPEESHWQEVFISLYEQDGGERDKKRIEPMVVHASYSNNKIMQSVKI